MSRVSLQDSIYPEPQTEGIAEEYPRQEIWELDYVKFKIPLLKCVWVNLNHVIVYKCGWNYVNLNITGYMNDPFTLTNQATQIFYVKDLAHPQYLVVMHEKWRIVGVESVRKRRIVEVRVQPV
jgi:hypothetical protein